MNGSKTDILTAANSPFYNCIGAHWRNLNIKVVLKSATYFRFWCNIKHKGFMSL